MKKTAPAWEYMEWVFSDKGVPWRWLSTEFDALLTEGWEILAVYEKFLVLKRPSGYEHKNASLQRQLAEALDQSARVEKDKARLEQQVSDLDGRVETAIGLEEELRETQHLLRVEQEKNEYVARLNADLQRQIAARDFRLVEQDKEWKDHLVRTVDELISMLGKKRTKRNAERLQELSGGIEHPWLGETVQ